MRSPEGAKHTELPKEAPKNLLLCSVTHVYSEFIAITCDSEKSNITVSYHSSIFTTLIFFPKAAHFCHCSSKKLLHHPFHWFSTADENAADESAADENAHLTTRLASSLMCFIPFVSSCF